MSVLKRLRVAGIGTLALGMVIVGTNARAEGGETAITCINPASGTSWQIMVDHHRRTVDSNPARISDTEISWRDAKDSWNYTLNRKSGALTVSYASSTGGNILFDRCKLD